MSEPVLVERVGRRGELVLNRPERKNALNGPLVEGLLAGLEELSTDDEVGAILIRGAGGGFCAGLDLKEFAVEPPQPWRKDFGARWCDFHSTIFDCPKPVVGALEGFAIAGGSGLALACDLLIAGEGAFFEVAEARLGRPAPMNVAWLMLKLGLTRTYELVMSAERYYGGDLARLGLAVKATADGEVLAEARLLTDRLASFPPAAHLATRRIVARLAPFQNARDFFAAAQEAAAGG